MTEHLPECADKNSMPHYLDCFCDVLRACEQRMRESWYEVQSQTWEQGFCYALDAEYGAAKYRRGYLYALELAGDAISDTAKALGLKDNSPVVKMFIDSVNVLRDEH